MNLPVKSLCFIPITPRIFKISLQFFNVSDVYKCIFVNVCQTIGIQFPIYKEAEICHKMIFVLIERLK